MARQFRQIQAISRATRYAKRAVSFLGAISLAATVVLLH